MSSRQTGLVLTGGIGSCETGNGGTSCRSTNMHMHEWLRDLILHAWYPVLGTKRFHWCKLRGLYMHAVHACAWWWSLTELQATDWPSAPGETTSYMHAFDPMHACMQVHTCMQSMASDGGDASIASVAIKKNSQKNIYVRAWWSEQQHACNHAMHDAWHLQAWKIKCMKGTLSCAQPLHFLLCVLLTPHISQTMHACMHVCLRTYMHALWNFWPLGLHGLCQEMWPQEKHAVQCVAWSACYNIIN